MLPFTFYTTHASGLCGHSSYALHPVCPQKGVHSCGSSSQVGYTRSEWQKLWRQLKILLVVEVDDFANCVAQLHGHSWSLGALT
eukprot:SAG31_NODE_453_length_15464_cov_37.074064_10_plen_84_part_00